MLCLVDPARSDRRADSTLRSRAPAATFCRSPGPRTGLAGGSVTLNQMSLGCYGLSAAGQRFTRGLAGREGGGCARPWEQAQHGGHLSSGVKVANRCSTNAGWTLGWS